MCEQESEWLFMTLHAMHIGPLLVSQWYQVRAFVFALSRLSLQHRLMREIENETNARKMESYLMIKPCFGILSL